MNPTDENKLQKDAVAVAPATPQPMPEGRFEGREVFAQLVRDALRTAARDGWREIILCDADFQDWPLGERSVVESLQAWAKTGRRLTMLAKTYDDVVRRHARFVAWRVSWSHIIECRRCAISDPLDIPSALWSQPWMLHRIDPEMDRGVCGGTGTARVALRESIDEWMRRSAPGFAASTLGL